MKQYCLKHPKYGYLTTNKWFYGSWSNNIGQAKKWSSISHVKSLQKQTTRENRKECEIIEIELEIKQITKI